MFGQKKINKERERERERERAVISSVPVIDYNYWLLSEFSLTDAIHVINSGKCSINCSREN